MTNQITKPSQPTYKGLRETEEFQHFQKLLSAGFVAQGTTLTNPELLKFSEKLAKILKRSDRRDSETATQFRSIFQQINGLQHCADTVQIQVELRLLKARMAYAAGRKMISRDFSLVLQECFDAILNCEQMQTQLPGLCGFFESLYAYYYYQAQKDNRRRRG